MQITIPVIPTGQQRPRFTARGKFGHAYKSGAQKKNERDLCFYIDQQKPEVPISGPIKVDVIAYMPIPKSWSKARRNAAMMGTIRPTTKPDVDNVLKNVLDCSNGVLFDDDKQVVCVVGRKHYSDEPRIEMTIERVT